MIVQPGSIDHDDEYAEIAKLYYLLRLRSLSNPSFLNRTLRLCRYGIRRRRRRRIGLLDLLPMRLCQLNTGVTAVKKCLVMLVKNIESHDVRFHRLACFLVRKERLIDSNEFILPESPEPGALMFLSFDYDFLRCHYDERDWIVIGYVYNEAKAEPHAAFELDLAHIFKNFMRRLSDIVIDVALEHPIHEDEVGRMQLQLSWCFSPGTPSRSPKAISATPNFTDSEITFKYSLAGGKECLCETIPWGAGTSRCPFCYFVCPDVNSVILHMSLSHDRILARYYSNTISIEPLNHHEFIQPVESIVVYGGRDTIRSVTERVLNDCLLTARQANAVNGYVKRHKTVAKSVQSAQSRSNLSKQSKRNHVKFNGKSSGKKKFLSTNAFYHGSVFVPIMIGQVPEGYKDSDLEIDDSWILQQQNQTIAMFDDVKEDDKELMILWNESRKLEPEIVSDRDIVPFCERFAQMLQRHGRCLRMALLNHLLVLWEFGLLSNSHIKRIVSIYDGRDEYPRLSAVCN